ncbi:hypothetical protein KI387_044633, partial [Taxus chinensis]
PVFPITLRLPTFEFMQEYMEESDQIQARILDILQMEESRNVALNNFSKHQEIVKRWFDKRAK